MVRGSDQHADYHAYAVLGAYVYFLLGTKTMVLVRYWVPTEIVSSCLSKGKRRRSSLSVNFPVAS